MSEILISAVIEDTLDLHGVAHRRDVNGHVWAWEAASIRRGDTYVDASEWVRAPTTKDALGAWLGY